MKKRSLIAIISFLFIICIFSCKLRNVYYISFKIPGEQMAATIPPFGTFIESNLKYDKELLRHEMVHWDQYDRMGFFNFYSTYISEYKKYGRKNGPMEIEARKLSRIKSKK